MTRETDAQTRLERLKVLVAKELHHLQGTDQRLFVELFTPAQVERLEGEPELAERVEAFSSRFGRVQDTLGDKLLPAYLVAHGEKPATFIENLDRAERLGLIIDAQAWLDMRKLRNQMVHDYIEDPLVLASALNAGHAFVSILVAAAARFGVYDRSASISSENEA